MVELDNLSYYDSDIWKKCLQTIQNKKRINNITYFSFFVETIRKLNTDPKGEFFKKLDANLSHLKENHYNSDR